MAKKKSKKATGVDQDLKIVHKVGIGTATNTIDTGGVHTAVPTNSVVGLSTEQTKTKRDKAVKAAKKSAAKVAPKKKKQPDKKSSGSTSYFINHQDQFATVDTLPDQPYVPYVHIEVAGVSLDDPPVDTGGGTQTGSGNLITDFRIDKKSSESSQASTASNPNAATNSGGDTVTFTCVDETAVMLEYLLTSTAHLQGTDITSATSKGAAKYLPTGAQDAINGANKQAQAQVKAGIDTVKNKSQDLSDTTLTQGLLQISYGYYKGKRSPLESYIVQQIVPEFTDYGMRLTVTAMSQALVSGQERSSKSYTNMTPSDIVKDIAQRNGYATNIVDAKMVYEYDSTPLKKVLKSNKNKASNQKGTSAGSTIAGMNNWINTGKAPKSGNSVDNSNNDSSDIADMNAANDATTKKVPKTYRQNNLGDLEFITNVLLPDARAADGTPGKYAFWTSQNASGQTVYNFMPIAKATAEGYLSKGNQTDKSNDALKSFTFKWGSVENTTVKSFTPHYLPLNLNESVTTKTKDAGTGDNASAAVTSNSIDAFTGKMFGVGVSAASGPLAQYRDQYNPALKSYIGSSATDFSQLEAVAAKQWYDNMSQTYNAEMVLIGDPNFQMMTLISVIIMNPNGLPHHSSGVYLITGISDQISNGEYETTLTLSRNSLTAGYDSNGNFQLTVGQAAASDDDTGSGKGSGSGSGSGGDDDADSASNKLSGSAGAFGKKFNGHSVGSGQCYSLASLWTKELTGKTLGAGVNGPQLKSVGDTSYAKNIGTGWDWKAVNGHVMGALKASQLHPGDMLAMTSGSNAGHVAIVTGISGNHVTVAEQYGNGDHTTHVKTYTYKNGSLGSDHVINTIRIGDQK